MVKPILPSIPFVTIAGLPASGKTRAGLELAERLGWEFETTGGIMRAMAQEDNMTPDAYYARGFTNDGVSIDKVLDNRQIELGKTHIEYVLDGRLAFNFIPNSYKLFFTVDPDVASKRVYNDSLTNSLRTDYSSVSEAKSALASIVEREKERYGSLYGIDHTDSMHFNKIIDTTDIPLEELGNEVFYHVKSFLDSFGYFDGTYNKK